MAVFIIDQSMKVESTQGTSIGVETIGTPGKNSISSIFSGSQKQQFYKQIPFRHNNFSSKKDLHLRLFSYLIFLTIQPCFKKRDVMVIDFEYQGNEQKISDLLISIFKRHTGIYLDRGDIRFENVGKQALFAIN